MNILWGVLGFCGIEIHVAALETPAWSHTSIPSPLSFPQCPSQLQHRAERALHPPGQEGEPSCFTSHQVSVVFLFADKQEQSISCQWSSSIFCEWFLGEECGVWFIIPSRRGEGSCKSHLRLLPAAPWNQQSCWEVQGRWRSRSLCRDHRRGKHRLAGIES